MTAAGPDAHGFRIVAAGDSVLVVEFEARIDPAVNARATSLARALEAAALPGVRDVVPTFRSVAVFFDPLRTDYPRLLARLKEGAAHPAEADVERVRPVEVPVCYGGTFGPDLPAVAAFAGLSEQDVIDLHAAGRYRVFMLGFMPGFAYMGVVDARISMPRRDTPRVRVPRGSVAIAGSQTGVYPSDSPGGWHVIGRTPVQPFDPCRADPFLFKPGDRVRFRPVGADGLGPLR